METAERGPCRTGRIDSKRPGGLRARINRHAAFNRMGGRFTMTGRAQARLEQGVFCALRAAKNGVKRTSKYTAFAANPGTEKWRLSATVFCRRVGYWVQTPEGKSNISRDGNLLLQGNKHAGERRQLPNKSHKEIFVIS